MAKFTTRSGKTLLIVLAVIAGLILIIGAWFASSYNNLVTLDQRIESAWADVEVQYQRRADLVPQLVNTVKGAANFEQDTLTAVTEARTQWLNAQQGGDLETEIAASQQLDSALSRLLVTVESYPQLTATEGFQALQAQLEGTENRVAVARNRFNDAVEPYNIRVKRFPTVILANMFGFEPKPFFEAADAAADAPEVNFEN